MRLAKKHQRTLARMRANPKPSNLKFRDLDSLLKALGFVCRGSGNGLKYSRGKHIITLHPPHPRPDVDKGCIAGVLSALERVFEDV